MKRTLLVVLAIAALAAGCATANLPGPGPSVSGTAALPGGTALPLASVTPAVQPVSDFTSLVEHLTAAGATVEQTGDTANSVFTGRGRILKVNGGEVQVFEYPDVAAADAEAARIAPDGSKIDNSMVDWPASPHFYKKDRLLIAYVGNDLQVINPLEFVVGRQFAGSPVSLTPNPTSVANAPASATPVAAAPAAANCIDRAVMSLDVTIPDNTVVKAGQTFLKTWRLQNTGTCTWTNRYALAFVKGTNMGGPAAVPFPGSVAPGKSVDLSVTLTAPAAAGSYRGNYQLRNAAGRLFAITNSNDGSFWVLVAVSSAPPATSKPPTPSARRITFPAGSTGVSFNVTPPVDGSVTYLLAARAGQELHIGAGGPGLVLIVRAPDGTRLDPGSTDPNGLSIFSLPAAGDYSLAFSGSANQVTIVVPAPTSQLTPIPPERITFGPGVTGAARDVNLSSGQIKSYILTALANQTMHVVISQPGYTLVVKDPSGQGVNPLNSGSGRYDFRLPLDGDYILTLQGTGANKISIEIPPLTPVTRERITFGAGKTSATVNFNLSGTKTQEYVLAARAGQRLLVDLTAPGTSVLLIAPDGRATSPQSVDAGGQHVQYQLAQTGDFIVSLQGASNTMTVQIPAS